jgi:predicted RNase H-like HicB family nuclease
MITYLATIHKDNHSDYGVQFYDFPGCISAGETIEEAKMMATEALKGHISFMLADGDKIPTPSTLETILSDADHQDAVAFMPIEVSDAILTHQELCVKT